MPMLSEEEAVLRVEDDEGEKLTKGFMTELDLKELEVLLVANRGL